MQALYYTVTITAPVSKVRDIMLNHPTYEQWTSAFSEWSTYVWSRDQGSEIKFGDGSGSQQGMIAKIAHNRLHEYISIQHLWEIGTDGTTTMFAWESFENYTFTKIDDTTTQLDVELTAMPDERIDMFNEMWPKALELLKGLCTQ
jgi:hypothetical protein